MKAPIGRITPIIMSKNPDNMTVTLPTWGGRDCCFKNTAKKMETEVGGAMMNGVFVMNADKKHPMAHVIAVATMEPVVS